VPRLGSVAPLLFIVARRKRDARTL